MPPPEYGPTVAARLSGLTHKPVFLAGNGKSVAECGVAANGRVCYNGGMEKREDRL